MKRTRYLAVLVAAFLAPLVAQADDTPALTHLYLCRSPILAFDFWETLQDIQQKGVTITPTIAAEVCAHMKAGNEPQCIKVEAANFEVTGTDYQGAMTMSDGKTKFWFHDPDAIGWVHPQYYVMFAKR
jgi:hypothetical protein